MFVNGYEIKPHSDLSGANLLEANLEGANLEGANLRGAKLWGANLGVANLEGANLRGANLRWANFEEANLGGAKLEEVNLCGANLRGANLEAAKGIIRIGPSSDGYEFFGVIRGGNVWIKAGCRWFTASEARVHWINTRGGTGLGNERLKFVDFIEGML